MFIRRTDAKKKKKEEGLMLKPQYFGHLMWRADSLKKTLMLGKLILKSTKDSMDSLPGATTGDPTHDKGHAEEP